MYLLDANVLIDADRDYYSLDRVPEYWEWLVHHGTNNRLKICIECYEEITDGRGELPAWLKRRDIRAALLLDEESDPGLVDHVVQNGYANDLTDIEIGSLGRDPFLIAHALKDAANRRVITTEHSVPSKIRHNRKIPDVCSSLGITCRNGFQFARELDFKTNWTP